jgi:hypothetical protein
MEGRLLFNALSHPDLKDKFEEKIDLKKLREGYLQKK